MINVITKHHRNMASYCIQSLNMKAEYFPSFWQIKPTLYTNIFNSIVNRLHMLLKVLFPSCIITTLRTNILNSNMNRSHMLLKTLFLSCLMVTLHTIIFNSIVNRLHMLLKVLFLSCLITTLQIEATEA